jgi:hypothetical protein
MLSPITTHHDACVIMIGLSLIIQKILVIPLGRTANQLDPSCVRKATLDRVCTTLPNLAFPVFFICSSGGQKGRIIVNVFSVCTTF